MADAIVTVQPWNDYKGHLVIKVDGKVIVDDYVSDAVYHITGTILEIDWVDGADTARVDLTTCPPGKVDFGYHGTPNQVESVVIECVTPATTTTTTSSTTSTSTTITHSTTSTSEPSVSTTDVPTSITEHRITPDPSIDTTSTSVSLPIVPVTTTELPFTGGYEGVLLLLAAFVFALAYITKVIRVRIYPQSNR